MSDDAIRAFLGELIDDAGLFPPARLPMTDAIRAHESAAGGDAFWLAGRFVVAATRLVELASALDAAPRALPVAVVVDRPVADAPTLAGLARDAAEVADRAAVETIDVPLARLPGNTNDDRFALLGESLAAAEFPAPLGVYVEVPLGGEAGEDALLAVHRARERGFAVRAKIRCGGLEPSAVPSVDDVARFMWTANRLAVPFKATAGLHEALRHTDATLGTDVHGFLNVIGGAVLVRARGLDRATLVTLLLERDASAFELDRHRFAWRGIGADASEIGEARSTFAHSYGSCSFDEPVRDLRALGILPQPTAAR